MPRKFRVLLFTLCATLVSVAIWVVAVLLNLLHWLFGEASFVNPVAWTLVVVSAAAFWVVFYRHFNRTEAR